MQLKPAVKICKPHLAIFTLNRKQAAPRTARCFFAIQMWQVFVRKLAGKNCKDAIFTRFPGSLETSLREPAFASIANATRSAPFQSGLGSIPKKTTNRSGPRPSKNYKILQPTRSLSLSKGRQTLKTTLILKTKKMNSSKDFLKKNAFFIKIP